MRHVLLPPNADEKRCSPLPRRVKHGDGLVPKRSPFLGKAITASVLEELVRKPVAASFLRRPGDCRRSRGQLAGNAFHRTLPSIRTVLNLHSTSESSVGR